MSALYLRAYSLFSFTSLRTSGATFAGGAAASRSSSEEISSPISLFMPLFCGNGLFLC